jgi:hypothetical protein
LGGAGPTAHFSDPPTLEQPQAGFYRFKIRKPDVIAVNDGATLFDVLGVLVNRRQGWGADALMKSMNALNGAGTRRRPG